MLKLDGVRTFYGPIEALKGVSLEVRQGEIVSLLGGNGAGKSTTLMTISGVNTAASGSITYEGRSLVLDERGARVQELIDGTP